MDFFHLALMQIGFTLGMIFLGSAMVAVGRKPVPGKQNVERLTLVGQAGLAIVVGACFGFVGFLVIVSVKMLS